MKGYGLTLLRVAVGALHLVHGYRLLVVTTPAGAASFVAATFGLPHPTLVAWGLIAVYGLGGLLIAVGLLTRPAAAVAALVSAVVLVRVDLPQGLSLRAPTSVEHALLLTVATVAILTLGSGPLALRPSR